MPARATAAAAASVRAAERENNNMNRIGLFVASVLIVLMILVVERWK